MPQLHMMLLLLLQEPYVLSECITVLNSNTDKSIFCRHGEIIQIKNATLFRSNSLTHCEELHPSNVSPYPCETMSTEVIDTIWSSCHEQNHCRYELEYPDEDDCPDYRRNRTILLVIILECVSRKYIFCSNYNVLITQYPMSFVDENDSQNCDNRKKGLVFPSWIYIGH